MINISIDNIKSILISIVASWPYEQKYRLNTFAITQSRSDYGSNNFNKTHRDYLANDYWVRGYSPSNDARKPGFLTVEHPFISESDLKSNILLHNLWITVAHDPSNPECPDNEQMSDYELFLQAVADLRMVIKQFKEYIPYNLKLGEVETTAWMHPNKVPLIEGDYDSVSPLNRMGVASYIEDLGVPVNYSPLNIGGHGFIAATCMIKIKSCGIQSDYNFDYTYADCENKGVVACDLC